MNTRRLLGIITVAMSLGIATTAYVTDAQAKGKGGSASIGNFGNAGAVKGITGSVRDRRGQPTKTVNVPPKVVPKRCIITPTHCRPYDPTKPYGGKRPQVQDHR
jgi:hypothetical protein